MGRARWVAALAAVLAGCSGHGGDDAIVPPGDDDDDTTDTEPPPVDTAPDGVYLDAAYFAILGRFAYDPAVGLTSFVEPGGAPSPLEVTVMILDSSAVSTGILDETTSCTVTMTVDPPVAEAAWVASHGAWVGFDAPSDAPVRDNCQFYGFPSEFHGDMAAQVRNWTWGVGVGPLDPYVESKLRLELPASEWAGIEPYVIGGAASSNLFTTGTTTAVDGYTDLGFAMAYQVDGNFEIAVGGTGNPLPIPSSDVHTEDQPGVALGYYEVQLGLYGPASAMIVD